MQKCSSIFLGFVILILLSCADSNTSANTANEVPEELTKGVWATPNTGGAAVEVQFFNDGKKGRYRSFIKFANSQSLVEGTVKFEGDIYTVYPTKGEVKSLGERTKTYPESWSERFEIRNENGATFFVTFNKEDIHLNSPVYHVHVDFVNSEMKEALENW
jgi:hypothetical protein